MEVMLALRFDCFYLWGDVSGIHCIGGLMYHSRYWCNSEYKCLNKSKFQFSQSFSHSVFCLTTGLQPLPKRVLRRVRYIDSSFNLQYPRFILRSSSSCWRLLARLPVTCILPSILPNCYTNKYQVTYIRMNRYDLCLHVSAEIEITWYFS